MKTIIPVLAFCIGATAASAVTEKIYVVEVTDLYGKTFVQTATLEQYKELRLAVSTMNRYVPRALSKAKADWKASEDTRKTAFPAKVASKAEVKSQGICSSMRSRA